MLRIRRRFHRAHTSDQAHLASRARPGPAPGGRPRWRGVSCLVAGLLAVGLAVTVAPGFAAAAARASHTIKNAQSLTLKKVNSGGNGAIDFWKVHLIGGDQVQIATNTPNLVGCCTSYFFELFKPGTTDTNFPQTPPVMGTATPGASTRAILPLQAPYTATFIFAVCENVSGDCRNVDAGGGTNPMGAYSFTPTLVNGGIKPGVGAKETRASPTIAKAPLMPVGNFEAAGGDPVDFWQVHLIGGGQGADAARSPLEYRFWWR